MSSFQQIISTLATMNHLRLGHLTSLLGQLVAQHVY